MRATQPYRLSVSSTKVKKSTSSASVLPVYTEIHLFELTVYHLNLRCSTWVPLKIFAFDCDEKL